MTPSVPRMSERGRFRSGSFTSSAANVTVYQES